MIAGDLASARSKDRDEFSATLDETTITDEAAEIWMRVIGDARLVLGARLGIQHDDWEMDPSLADSGEGALVNYLGYLQDSLIQVLSPAL